MKICKKCLIEKPSDEFYTLQQKQGGKVYVYHQLICKQCKIEKSGTWAKNNPEKNRAKSLKHLHKIWDKYKNYFCF